MPHLPCNSQCPFWIDKPIFILPGSGQYSNFFDNSLKGASVTGYDNSLAGASYDVDGAQIQNGEDTEDGSRKKKVSHSKQGERFRADVPCGICFKLKKSHGFEQYVCRKCGRTDSPEWRKVIYQGIDHNEEILLIFHRDQMDPRLSAMLVVFAGQSKCVSLMNLEKKRSPAPVSHRPSQWRVMSSPVFEDWL
jgi:hypothetical protein